ncbi:sigma-70 family RNA polymerase sigma factor [Photobacterium sp. SP02]|uniref:Sigma-70 family RNA polymerase sigma factor n=1 Tax=Photobacterium halotolerans TaxID=265726 RepID=A0A7X4WBA7_9GAMM|nr:sigma-70 family RNA polymerase sigma factor [Photobacterium halotolerans]NAW65498.1 sigma-70 family RNA polymerase sigma factor [Photobacterium halotolerans]NAX48907.1 sigma-70 family RNA polymerase sigma factor [Photobacterium halotolerans]
MTGADQFYIKQVGRLYQQHQGWLSVFIQRRMSCPFTTADLVQDTYLRLLSSGRLPASGESRRYLTHIAKGLVIDFYRRRRVESAYLEYLQQQPQQVAVSSEERLQMVEALLEVDRLMRHLPDKVRQALLMRQIDNMSYKQIAAELEVSVSSVEKYIAKALQACMTASMEAF